MKKLAILFSLTLLLSGCSLVQVQQQTYQEMVHDLLVEDIHLKNVSLEGYSYYLPKGVLLKRNQGLNSILYYKHKKMYLYVDVLSYYHKVESEYEEGTENYFSMKIDQNGKQGYLEITEISTKYFVEFMYHYSKIEAYVEKEDLKETVTKMAYILNSVQYQDAVLNTLVGDKALDYNEENFNIFKPKREDGKSFLDYQEEEMDRWLDGIDEDKVDIDGDLE